MAKKKTDETVEEVVSPKVTSKALAAELGTNDRELRKFLRDTIGKDNKPGGRWEWDEDDAQLAEIREAYAAKKATKASKPDQFDGEVTEDEDDDFEIDDID